MIFKSLLLFILMNTILFAQVHKFDMTIEEGTKEVAPNLKYKVWGFNGQVPGPLIHVKEGDDLEVTVLNKTSLPHTIHWHGVLQKNTWKMDGVPNVTQEAIEPGDTFTYKFKADKPGTLWYHCHVNVAEHVGLRGMWGLLIVDPKDPIAIENEVNKEVILAFSAWDSSVADSYGKGGHPQSKADYFSINGKAFPFNSPLVVKKGDVVRFRLLAVSSNVAFHLHGHDMLVTHKDGLPLSSPYWADVIPLLEGERIDAIVRMDNPGRWLNHDHIEHHTSNSGKMPGGAVMIVEYEDIEKEDWYIWKDKKVEKDYFFSESMKKSLGIHNNPGFKIMPLKKEKRKKRKKKS
ncbi:MAG: multicopper oxidase domain-containing protein [Campylobacterales bacterium]|nr:multicopper oxidase domain-containing protein [Campylobacterales bacterium]